MGEWRSRLGWTAWALAPVAALALHFGPGQRWDRRDRAEALIDAAARAMHEATALQDAAYETHLAALAARMNASGTEDAALNAQAAQAAELDGATAARAEGAWRRVADALSPAIEMTMGSDAALEGELRVSRAHAAVRAGDIGEGADDLEALLDELDDSGKGEGELARKARAELGTAYYYGARLLRMSGKPAEVWKEIAARSRQQFRYLAEQGEGEAGDARAGTGDDGVRNGEGGDRREGATTGTTARAEDHRKNIELVLNLEQSSLDELYAKARPKDSPIGTGNRLGKGPRRGRGPSGNGPPQNGAGMGDEVGPGW